MYTNIKLGFLSFFLLFFGLFSFYLAQSPGHGNSSKWPKLKLKVTESETKTS